MTLLLTAVGTLGLRRTLRDHHSKPCKWVEIWHELHNMNSIQPS